MKPQMEHERAVFEACENEAGVGATKPEKLASYEALAVKYPDEYLTVKVFTQMADY